ncbi:MAG: hypothetical protein AB1762_12295 [Gemmatimonadota bacterium]
MVHFRDRLERLEGDASAVARERFHAGADLSSPAPPALIEDAHPRAREQIVVLYRSDLPRGFVVREVTRERVIHGPALFRREDHHFPVLLPGTRDLDLTQRTRRSRLVLVRCELRQDEHAARASEHLTGPALGGELDRQTDTRVDARIRDCGEDPPVLFDRVTRAMRSRPSFSGPLRPLFFERPSPLCRCARSVGRYQVFFAKPRSDAVDRIYYAFCSAHPELLAFAGLMTIGHPAPKRPRLRGDERDPGQVPVEKGGCLTPAAEQPLAVLDHLVIPARPVRAVLSSFRIEREVEARSNR